MSITIASSLTGQTNIDFLTKELENLTVVSYDNWKYSVGTSFDKAVINQISAAGYNDTDWKSLQLRQQVYVDSCWIRKELMLPEKYMGEAVSGSVKLLLSLDDYGYLWVDGEEKGHFTWEGEFVLTEDTRPGMKFTVLIKAHNTAGPLRLLRAQLKFEKQHSLPDQIDDLSISLRVGQKLLSSDTYQTNARVTVDPGIEKSKMDKKEKERLYQKLQDAAAQVDFKALRSGNITQFIVSIEKIRPVMKEADAFVKRFALHFNANAHIDAAWLWRRQETQAVCKNTFSAVDSIMNLHPEFTYTQSTACYYDWMQNFQPRLFEAIQKRVREGRWEIIGGSWIEPDCNLIDGVSWTRQLLYGQRYFQKNFGKTVKIGWNPDSFGYNWNMPQFYRNAGVDVFITQKIGWNDTNVFPHRLFWWEGPDGSHILSYFPFSYVNQVTDPCQFADWLRQFEANTGFTNLLVLFGVGDHGGGPSMDMLERIERLKKLSIYPKIQYGTTDTYLSWLKEQDLTDIPVWKDELYLEYHRGTLTTQAEMKADNRNCEVLLTNVEKFAVLAGLHGFPYPSKDLEEAWRIALFNQFHDILPGSSIREVHLDAGEDYRRAQEIGKFQLSRALQTLGSQINTSGVKKGKAVVVFNPLSWERSGVVHLRLEKGDRAEYAVFELNGEEVPSQIIQTAKYDRELIFPAKEIPSLGYRVFELRQQTQPKFNSNLQITENSLENEFFKVMVNPETGWIENIFDKKNNREVLNGPGNELQLFDDRPSAWDAWNIGLGKRFYSEFRGMEIVENGPVRVVLRIKHDFLSSNTHKGYPTEDFPTSFFEQDIILYRETPRVDFRTVIDWWEEHVMLKVAFPVAVQAEVANYEIPFATIQRSTMLDKQEDKGKWEVSAIRWADISQNDCGVSLLNNSKYGYDIKDNVMRLSLLRSPTWPDPTADRGKHLIEYSLYPHKGNWREAQTVQRGYEFNTPLAALAAEKHKGKLPERHSFISLAPQNLILTAVKQAEDEESAWLIQWYESLGKEAEAVLTLPKMPSTVFLSNFLEENLEPVDFTKNEIRFTTKKNKVITLKVYF
jgi:alpha-mannosidase